MKEIVEQFGMCMLQMLPAFLLIGLYIGMMCSGGVLSDIVSNYMRSICG